MALILRRLLAPVLVVGSVAAIAFAAASPVRSTPKLGPDRVSVSLPGSTSSSPYWTLPPTSTPSGNPQVAMDAVQWTQVAYPGSCGTASTTQPSTSLPGPDSSSTTLQVSTGFTVDQVSFAQPDSSDQVAVVLVQCGNGALPVGLFVYEGAQSVTEPKLLQILVPESQDVYGSSFEVRGKRISMTVQSGSPERTGACCAGLGYSLSWVWSKGSYKAG